MIDRKILNLYLKHRCPWYISKQKFLPKKNYNIYVNQEQIVDIGYC